ncbi:MAG TPA: hypothetical protein VHB99_18765 [Pirellulales bacterium]|nr:hypothetical protein [Pirellulales bacterium]
MSIPIWCVAAAAPFLMSLGYLAGEMIAYATTKEIDAAWVLLALRVQQFLAKCGAGNEPFNQLELAEMREALRLLDDLHELPECVADCDSSDHDAKLGAA